METIIASTLLSLSTNIDNFAVGIAYSVKKLTISFPANLLIASLSGISTFTSMSVGDWINRFLSPNIAHELGSGILILIGLITIWDILKKKFSYSIEEKGNNREIKIHNSCKNNRKTDVGQSRKIISLREALLLGLALTIALLKWMRYKLPGFKAVGRRRSAGGRRKKTIQNLLSKIQNHSTVPHSTEKRYITNLGTGIGAGIAQLDLALTSCLSFFSSLLTIGGGFFLGNLVNVSSTKCEKDSFRQTLVCRNPHSFVAKFLTPLPKAREAHSELRTSNSRWSYLGFREVGWNLFQESC